MITFDNLNSNFLESQIDDLNLEITIKNEYYCLIEIVLASKFEKKFKLINSMIFELNHRINRINSEILN